MSIEKAPSREKQSQKDILEQLAKTQSAADRTRLFAHLLDTLGIDAIVGLLPLLGDAGMSIIAASYFLCESLSADLSGAQMLKIIGNQTTDALIGTVSTALTPVGDALADYSFQANHRSADIFEKKVAELTQKAKDAGVSSDQLKKIDRDRSTRLTTLNKFLSGLNIFHSNRV